MKKIVKILFVISFLMAFQCDDEIESPYIFNTYKVNVTPQSTFSVNDTIWINGKISSMVFDTSINDSIFPGWSQADKLLVMKFIQPTQLSNCKDGIDNFDLITEIGILSFSVCENAQMTVHSEISEDSSFYSYRLGLKPLNAGDYVLSWTHSTISNDNRNDYILDEYPIENRPNAIGFDKCGDVSWRYANESDKEFYFRVE